MEKKTSPAVTLPRPPKPVLSPTPRGTSVKLMCNFFHLQVATSNFIYVYDVKFIEEIPSSNTPLKKSIIRGLREELEKTFKLYFFTGSMLYSPNDIGPAPISLSYTLTALKYQVQFTRAQTISVKDILCADKNYAKAQTVRTFLNLIVKCLLSACNMFPVGRTGKYLLPSGAKIIKEYPIEVWPGYFTSVNVCEAGLLLEIDYASRILRQESVYDLIRSKLKLNSETYMDVLKEEVVGKVVLTRYGNKQSYMISDIDFNLSPLTHEFEFAKNKITLDTYFKQKYFINIKDKAQPLLACIRTQRDGTEQKIYLVPELCSLTGIPEELKEDRFALKQLSVYTKLSPDQRIEEVQKLLRSFTKTEPTKEGTVAPSAARKIMQGWNLEIDMKPTEVQGRVLPPQEIQLAKGKVLKVGENGQFFFKESVTMPLALDKWILVYTEKDKSVADNFVDVLYKASQTFCISVNYPTYAESKGIKAKDFLEALIEPMTKIPHPEMIVFLLPPPSVHEYSALKKHAIQQTPPLFTQMVKSKTLTAAKNMMAVCSKLILQINAKRNGDLWRIVPPASVPRKSMIVGIDSFKEGKCSCMGFSSSYDPNFSRYNTQVVQLDSKKEAGEVLGVLLNKGLDKFIQETKKFLPDLIIIYRDGLSGMQSQKIYALEMQQMIEAVKQKFPDYQPKFLYATINKKIHTRFFMRASDAPAGGRKPSGDGFGLANPRPGTVLHSDIVDPNKYEFLYMPQHVNEGTGTPSRIEVLYDTSGLPIEAFEELTNSLCYGYYNWQGAIRSPAACKYAFAHSRLIAKYTKTLPNDQLIPYLYFL